MEGKSKGAIGGAVVVSNKGQDASAQLLHGNTIQARKQATDEDAEPDLNLVEPGTVSGSIHEANAMSRVGEKGCAGAHAGKMTTFASSRPDLPVFHTAQLPDAPAFPIDGCSVDQ